MLSQQIHDVKQAARLGSVVVARARLLIDLRSSFSSWSDGERTNLGDPMNMSAQPFVNFCVPDQARESH